MLSKNYTYNDVLLSNDKSPENIFLRVHVYYYILILLMTNVKLYYVIFNEYNEHNSLLIIIYEFTIGRYSKCSPWPIAEFNYDMPMRDIRSYIILYYV